MARNTGQINIDVYNEHPQFLMALNAQEQYVNQLTEHGYLHRFFVGQGAYLEGKLVCDAACGCGPKSCATASLNPKLVLGIDSSEPAIEIAKKLSDRLGLNNTTFVRGYLEDIVDIVHENGIETVDFVFNSFCIHHVEDWQRLIHDFSEILRPGGVLYINWVTAGRGWASFLIKNRVAFALGKDAESRVRIGRRLFGRWDRKNNKSNVDWESFWADRYAAFYRVITAGQLRRVLRRAGFEIVQTDPPMDIWEHIFSTPKSMPMPRVARIVKRFPFMAPLFSFRLRLRQFTHRGDIRAFVCVKTARPNYL